MFKKCLFNIYPTLKLNDKGPKVLKASELLAKHGSSLKPTEEFTLAMRNAVGAFQKRHEIPVTYCVDKPTWKALKKKHKKC